MPNDIRKQWDDYATELSSKVQYLIRTNSKLGLQINEELSKLKNSPPPKTMIELEAMKKLGGDLLSRTQPTAFNESSNHEVIAMPTESIAEQAEKAKEIR